MTRRRTIKYATAASVVALTATACFDIDNSGSSTGNTGQETQLEHWLINNEEVSTVLLENGSGILVNVQSATKVTMGNTDYARVTSTGIPDYAVTVDQSLLNSLNQRPKATTDFALGQTTAELFDIIEFGQDIGYNNNPQQNCADSQGYGYWPPGPGCPTLQEKEGYFPQLPTPNEEESCETGLGTIGYAINGTSIYNWGDGVTYNNEGIWHTLAPFAEVYDVDICGGHAAAGDYHHHFYTQCWGDVANEDAQGHSELLGYAADGYAIYGPWQDTNLLAKSCWIERDYSADSATGGGCADGDRSCTLNNPYDVSQGTSPISDVNTTPTLTGSYTSLSSNVFVTGNGFFKEDYYFDAHCSVASIENLDQYNGHEHGDLGYHYHVTVSSSDNKTPVYPFIIGPEFKGKLADNAVTQCGGIMLGGNMSPGETPDDCTPPEGMTPPAGAEPPEGCSPP